MLKSIPNEYRNSISFWKGLAAAKHFGLQEVDNPYPSDTHEHEYWLQGFRFASRHNDSTEPTEQNK